MARWMRRFTKSGESASGRGGQEEKLKVEYAESIAEGEAFMEENNKRRGGNAPQWLAYEVLKQGAVRPHGCRQGEVHYHGTLIDGTVFDSSVERALNVWCTGNRRVTEALQLMPLGRSGVCTCQTYGASRGYVLLDLFSRLNCSV